MYLAVGQITTTKLLFPKKKKAYYRCSKSGKTKCSQLYLEETDFNNQVSAFLDTVTVSDRFIKWAIKKLNSVNEKQKELSKMTADEWNTYFAGHWNFSGVRQNNHIAMFPEELPKRLIKMFSFVNETILDPFTGSGTTLLAAKNLDRNSIGYEINPDFIPIIQEKIGINEFNLSNSEYKIFKQENNNSNYNIENKGKKKDCEKKKNGVVDNYNLSINVPKIVKKITKKQNTLIKQIIRIKPIGPKH